MKSRRDFLKAAGAASATVAATGLLTGCDGFEAEPQSPVVFTPGQNQPGINWAGNQSCYPSARLAPVHEDELVAMLKSAKGAVRAVGASHSIWPNLPAPSRPAATFVRSARASSPRGRFCAASWTSCWQPRTAGGGTRRWRQTMCYGPT